MRAEAASLASRVLTALVRRAALPEAALSLVAASLRVRNRPFHELAAQLGTRGWRAPAQLGAAQRARARETEWLIGWVCRRMRTPPTCLVQAVAARAMLARRGVPATLYIGVGPSSADGDIRAHAWLESGGRIVTGRASQAAFKPIVWFG